MAHTAYGLNELREMYLKFFETKGHLRLPSFSLVPQHDKSVLLINAGMTPMKTWFTNEEEPPRRRVTTCQKCIRTPDIENIGKTDRHGTYFEMLGNFSFGDYFKHEAIAWAWEFLTSPEWVGLEADRLYPSVYLDDDDAWNIWHDEIGIPPEKIFRFGKEDNFWEHGSGPCGPCSEIYYDRGPEHGCGKPGCTVGCECDRYIEVWNIVFSQFNNDGHDNYTDLVQKNIDTGMGLERLACVCQNVGSLFDVDTVRNITAKVSEITGAHYHENAKNDVSLRIITDHTRSATMMICDGILPSNEGRGYVLRRIMRRAARHGKLLGVNEPFLYKVVDTVIAENKCAYPELVERRDFIVRVFKTEEETFARTIDGGMKIFSDMMDAHKAAGETVFSGDDAFKLYDTYGFPIDLTVEMAEEQGMAVDHARFDELMTEQKNTAREARKALGDLAWAGIDLGLDNTPTKFTGYDRMEDTGTVLALVDGEELCSELSAGMEGIIVLDKTPLYAEMGGQVADHGTITKDGAEFDVTDVQKDKAGKFLHHGVMKSGAIKVDDEVCAHVDSERRKAIMRAHSATHLLQKALQDVLGGHVRQAGSYVDEDRLRFDFTHFSAVETDELMLVMSKVNDMILDGMDVSIKEMPIEEARKLGAMALFGEKYGDTVRVVDMGGKSVEFCGGTHVNNTAKVGPFRIISESSVASGVRRIEAITGKEYLSEAEVNNRRTMKVASMLKTSPSDLLHRTESFMNEMRDMRQTMDKLKDRLMSGDAERVLYAAKTIGGFKVLTVTRSDLSPADLRKMGDFLRDREPNTVAVLATTTGDKVQFVAVCGKNAVEKGIKAGELVGAVSAVAGGKGGGKPDSAMGGGTEVLKTDDALAIVDDFVARKLGIL
jgi:alanyl-tRNA synthetase